MAETPKEYFEQALPKKLEANPEFAGTVNGSYVFDLSGDNGGTWTLDLTSAPGSVQAGAIENPGCTITMAADDFMKLLNKQLNPQMAFMTGKLKVKGNMQLALKLQKIF